MPMIELTTTKGALDDDAKQRLAGELATITLQLEAGPMVDFGDDDHMQEIFVGGQPQPKPIYRVTVTLPEGAPGLFGPLAVRGREKLVERVTQAVLDAEGTENTMVEAHRVWVNLLAIPDGHWFGFGDTFTMADIAAYSLKSDEPGSKTARMREAALESVGAVPTE